jgi:cytochrome d ubiquinol oxidase subunit II
VPLLALGALLAAGALIHREKMGWAFTMTTLTIVFTVATLFVSLYPRVMVSSLHPEWSLTIYNASSTPYTLKVMSLVAVVFVPIVLAYQAWTYWVFRHRIAAETKLEY